MSDSQGRSPASSHAVGSALSRILRLILMPAPSWLPSEVGWLIVVLGLAGIVVFGVTGFSGDANSPGILLTPFFAKPILLFWWLSALIVTLHLVMLRHPAPEAPPASRRQQAAGMLVSIASVVICTALTFAGGQVSHAVSDVPGGSGREFNQVLAIVINLWFFLAFWGDSGRRWIEWLAQRRKKRRAHAAARGTYSSSRASSSIAGSQDSVPIGAPSAWQRVGTDLMSAALLMLGLTVVFSTDVVSQLARALQSTTNRDPHVDTCTVSIVANCDPRQPLAPLQTLSGLDRLQAMAYFVIGAVVLGTFLLRLGINAGAPQTVKELMRILRESPLQVLVALIRPWRHALWPVCTFAAIFSATIAARDIQSYLRLLSEQHAMGVMFDGNPQNYALIGQAVVFGTLAPLATIAAIFLMLYPLDMLMEAGAHGRQNWASHIWRDWLRALVQIGLSVMASFLVYSLGLFVFNSALVFFIPVPVPQPFAPPGVSTYVVAFGLVFLLLADAWRTSRRQQPA